VNHGALRLGNEDIRNGEASARLVALENNRSLRERWRQQPILLALEHLVTLGRCVTIHTIVAHIQLRTRVSELGKRTMTYLSTREPGDIAVGKVARHNLASNISASSLPKQLGQVSPPTLRLERRMF
jgi:hypothetical protein